jgi:rare lipoprotein A
MFSLRSKWILVGLFGGAAVLPVASAQAQQVGHASWYALYSRTASGEMMNPSAMTAAHRSLPFGTKVLVENLSNGRSVVVRINDRGPFVGGRVIDLSKAAAAHIGMVGSGTAKVRISSAAGGTETASVDAAEQVASGKELAAKIAASEPADQQAEPSARVIEASASRVAPKRSASRRVSAKKAVASRTRAKGTRVAAKTRATGRSRSTHTRIASQTSKRARSATKRRHLVAKRESPYSGFAPSALLAG